MSQNIKIKSLIALPMGLSLAINFSEIMLYLDSPYVFFNTPRPSSIWLIASRLIMIFLYCFSVLYLNVFKTDQWLKKVNERYSSLGYVAINAIVYIITFFPFIYFQDKFVLKLHDGEAKGLAFIWLVFMIICVLSAAVIKLRAGIKKKLVDKEQFVRYNKEGQSFKHDMDFLERSYLTSFLLPRQKFLEPVKVKDFAIFYIDEGILKGKTFDSKTYLIDKNIQELEKKLDPSIFFRTNRQHLINRNAVKHLEPDSFGKTGLALNIDHGNVVISKLKSKQFKNWLIEFSG